MRKLLMAVVLLLAWGVNASAQQFAASGLSNPSRLVFAFYEPSFGAYGNTVAGYTIEIQQAQTAGIDGFVMDMFCWDPATTCSTGGFDYRTIVGYMFQAALNLNNGFKIILAEDCQGSSGCAASGGLMMTMFANHPNYFHYNGRPVVSAFNDHLNTASGFSDNTFFTSWLGGITGAGFNPYFIPIFKLGTFVGGDPVTTYNNYLAGFTPWVQGMVQGLGSFTGFIPTLYQQNVTAISQVATSKGNLTFMNAVSSWFAILRLLAANQQSEFLEFNGGEGLASLWSSIRTNNPPLVMVASWNDYTESYMGPASQADLTIADDGSWQITADYLFGHSGFTDLNRYYIQWWKTGVQPTWPDAMYVFYRIAPQSVVASSSPITPPAVLWNPQGNATLDDVYVTTILKDSATMRVTSGGNVTDTSVGAGLVHTRVPFTVGAQSFDLIRNGVTLIHIDGTPVVGSLTLYYNANPISYYAYSTP